MMCQKMGVHQNLPHKLVMQLVKTPKIYYREMKNKNTALAQNIAKSSEKYCL